MGKKRIKRTVRKTATPAEKAHYAKALEEERQGMEANRALGREIRAKHTSAARQALLALQELREANQMSLSDLETSTGMKRGNLSRLLNSPRPNVTVDTLERLATALDRTIRIELVER